MTYNTSRSLSITCYDNDQQSICSGLAFYGTSDSLWLYVRSRIYLLFDYSTADCHDWSEASQLMVELDITHMNPNCGLFLDEKICI